MTEGWDHTRWFAWQPADPDQPDGPGQAWRWTVPDGVDRVTVTAWGAGGGGSIGRPEDRLELGFAGGPGGLAVAEVRVTPGDRWVVVPGRGGAAGGAAGAGGWNAAPEAHPWLGHGGPGAPISGPELPLRNPEAGADGLPGCHPVHPESTNRCTGAGAGGGFSGVFLGDDLDDLAPDRVLILAGGGGGAGAGGPGGAGGGARGQDAPDCGLAEVSTAGVGGFQDTPGGSAVRSITLDGPRTFGTFGAALQGGSGGHAPAHMALNYKGAGTRGGGGGGGGWFGGGGGSTSLPGAPGCGGGGGSGHVVSAQGRLQTAAAPTLPAEDDATWGQGGVAGEPGGHGGVRIQW